MTDDLVKRAAQWLFNKDYLSGPYDLYAPEHYEWREGYEEAAEDFLSAIGIEALTAERDEYKRSADYSEDVVMAARAEIERLREAAIALRDDMMERARIKIDVVNGEEYRIVNAGRGAWENFCAALKGQQP